MNTPITMSDLSTDSPDADVCFFISSLQGGGAEKVLIDLMRGMRGRGLSVDVVVVTHDGALRDDVPVGVRYVVLNSSSSRWSRFGWCMNYLTYLQNAKPAHVIASLENGVLAALILGLLGGPHKLFIRIDGNLFWHRKGRHLSQRPIDLLKFGLARLLYRKAGAIVCVSDGLRDRIKQSLRLKRSRVITIYNPIPENASGTFSRGPLTEECRLLAVGRLVQEKDHATLLHSFAIVRAERACHLTILGEGELRPDLELLVRELGLEGSVSLPGYVANVSDYMRDSRMLILSSRSEGLPTVLVEALINRMLIVSTDCEYGPREILANGEFGVLVPVGDIRLLARGILDQLENPIRISDAHLSAHLDQFSVANVTTRYLKLMRVAESRAASCTCG